MFSMCGNWFTNGSMMQRIDALVMCIDAPHSIRKQSSFLVAYWFTYCAGSMCKSGGANMASLKYKYIQAFNCFILKWESKLVTQVRFRKRFLREPKGETCMCFYLLILFGRIHRHFFYGEGAKRVVVARFIFVLA